MDLYRLILLYHPEPHHHRYMHLMDQFQLPFPDY